MNRIIISLLLIFTLFLSGCFYINIRTPYDQNLNNTDLGSKQGTATTHFVLLSMFSWGDSSYAAAAKDGNITILKHADQEIKSYLGLYSKRTVIVYGD